jgi:aryl-alcohol dehydrogenase-like predicted oxidoreductase
MDDSLQRLGMDYVDLYQIHRFDTETPVEETMEALHDLVKAGKTRYLGASSMAAWQFAKMQQVAERNGWTRFIAMQPQVNLIYREEEREMLPLCQDQGVGVIPWSPLARGKLTRPWETQTHRSENDLFGQQLYKAMEANDRAIVERVREVAEARGVSMAQIALAWLLQKPGITSPIIGATKPEQLSDAIAALGLSLSSEEVGALEALYLPHPVVGVYAPPAPDGKVSLTEEGMSA